MHWDSRKEYRLLWETLNWLKWISIHNDYKWFDIPIASYMKKCKHFYAQMYLYIHISTMIIEPLTVAKHRKIPIAIRNDVNTIRSKHLFKFSIQMYTQWNEFVIMNNNRQSLSLTNKWYCLFGFEKAYIQYIYNRFNPIQSDLIRFNPSLTESSRPPTKSSNRQNDRKYHKISVSVCFVCIPYITYRFFCSWSASMSKHSLCVRNKFQMSMNVLDQLN